MHCYVGIITGSLSVVVRENVWRMFVLWLQHFCGPKRPQFQMASKDHKGQMNGFKRICTLAPSNGSNEQQYANVTDAMEEGSGRKY